MRINDFSGGLSVRKDPSMLGPSEAVILINVDNTSKKLNSVADYETLVTEARGSLYNFKGTWFESAYPRSYVEYDDKLFFSEYGSSPKVYNGSWISDIGYVAPTQLITVVNSPAVPTFVVNKDISAQSAAGNATGLYISPDGTKMYTVDVSTKNINRYNLATPFSLSTATFANSFSVSAKEAAPHAVYFKPDGTTFCVCGGNRIVYQYNMSTAWDITTAVFLGQSIVSGTAGYTFTSLYIKDDGLTYYTAQNNGSITNLYKYSNTTAWVFSTAAYAADTYAPTQDTVVGGITFSNDGKLMYLAGATNSSLYEYKLTTPYLLNSSVFSRTLVTSSPTYTAIRDVHYNPSSKKIYAIVSTTTCRVLEYNFDYISTSSGTYSYLYTFYDTAFGLESAGSEVSLDVSTSAVSVNTLTIPDISSVADYIRIYRTGGGFSNYALIAEIPKTTSYIDVIHVEDQTNLYESSANIPPPSDMLNMVEAYGIFFGSVGSQLYFSEVGNPYAWPPSNVIKFNGAITGLLPTREGLLVFEKARTHILLGTSVEDFTKDIYSLEQGCISQQSCKMPNNTPIWVSLEGLCTTSSGAVKVFSKDALGTALYSVRGATLFDDTYWLVLEDGSILALDTRFDNMCFKELSFDQPLKDLYAYEGVLYGSINNKLVKLFSGSSTIPLEYKSPDFIEDSYSEVKLYNNIYVSYNGSFTLEVFIDDVSVIIFNLSGNASKELNIPEDKQRGYKISFKIVGTGSFKEIEYKVQGRQNGR